MRGVVLLICLFAVQSLYGQIRIKEPVKHLGDIFEKQGVVKTSFPLFNPFLTDTIQITNIQTSCGCTAILTEERIILPRQTLDLVIAYDPENRPGLFMKTIKVETITGKNERNSMYLKIKGNVIAEHSKIRDKEAKLLSYHVAPITFYPITPYDTSYLDFNFFISFINDLTFEVDYYQFSTIGFDVEVENHDDIERLESLMRYTHQRIRRGFVERGFDPNTAIFLEPVFKESKLPPWATARVKVYSYYFNSDSLLTSEIKVSGDEIVEEEKLLLNYNDTIFPDVELLMSRIDFPAVESKLFFNQKLELKGMALVPYQLSPGAMKEVIEKYQKKLFKYLKKSTGIDEDVVSFDISSVSFHPDKRIRVLLWDKSDEVTQTKIQYVVKRDQITPPLLPTYRQSTTAMNGIDMANRRFRNFWRNLEINHQAGHKIKLLIESSTSKVPDDSLGSDKHFIARNRGEEAKQFLEKKFKDDLGADVEIQVLPIVHGPAYDKKYAKYVDFTAYEYLNIIPLVHLRSSNPEPEPKPYQVNFDYFFNGIDTSSIVFRKMANYISEAVQKEGYVKLRIESSISRVPIEKDRTNLYLAHSRSTESQNRIREHLSRLLIDPNRIIFTEERNLIQGPKYDGKTPIVHFREYQYLRIVPEKLLRQN